MANPYDDVVASWQKDNNRAPVTMTTNPYDAVVGEMAGERQQRTRTIFEKALAVNPDQAAETQKLTRTTGLPFSVIDRNFTEAKRREQARMLDLARLAQDSPVLTRQLLDPTFTSQVHDHTDNLSALEQTFNVVRAVPAGAARGVGGFLAGSGEIIDIGARNIGLTAVSRAVRDLTGADPGIALDVAGSLKFAGSGWKMLADAIGPDKEAQNFATDVAGGIGQLMQQIGVQIATGGTASLATLFSQGADVMADKTKGDRASQAMRDTAVLTGASITALTEKYGIDALLNRVPPAIKNSALRWIADKLVAGGIEATQEITEGVLQDVVRKLLTNPDATIGDGSLYEASVAGTSAAIVRAALGVRTRGAQEVRDGQQAERDSTQLKAQFDLASQALLRERNPEEFRNLVQSMANNTDGAPKEIYVDAEVLNQLAPEVFNQLPQAVRDAIPEALAANAAVAIPMGDVLTLAPGTPLEAMLVENARIGDPMAMSQVEAKAAGTQAQEFLAQEAQRVIQQASDQQAMQASSDRVKQGVLDQLNTVGRFRKDVNEGYATWTAAFYTTLAGRTGMTPEQMQAKYPLRITGQSGQGAVLNTGGLEGELTVEGYHFSMVDRPTLSTAMYGTGLKGSARDEILNNPDQRLKQRLSFYFDKGTGIRPESGVGGRAHRVQLTGVYDADADPLKLKTGNARDLESKLLDLGYKGYANRMDGTQPGQVIMLGEQTFTPELLGAQSRIESGQRVAPLARTEPQWQTQASGEPAMLQAKLERMQGNASWADYDLRIEGRELQARKKSEVLNQADAKVNNLTSVAERGTRVLGTRARFTAEEKQAVKDSAEKIGVSEKEITNTVRGHKLAHPTTQGWAPLTFVSAKIEVDDKGKSKVVYNYQNVPYSFSSDADGKQIDTDSPAYKKRVKATAKAMVDEVRRVFQRAANGDQNAKNILAQAGWYKAMRARLRQEFGGLGDLFADLLGATSPNTPVRDNWTNAVDTLRRASRGDYDTLLPKWVEWADTVDALELDLRGWFNERLTEGEPFIAEYKAARAARDEFLATAKDRDQTPAQAKESEEYAALKQAVETADKAAAPYSKAAIKRLPEYQSKIAALKTARVLDDSFLPTKESGRKYGFNGKNVARAMVDLWRVVKNADADIGRGDTAPKALNFSGNLIGFRTRATIDVWAARMLQRLAGGLRIPSMAETGVSGAMREDGTTTLQFGMGQDIFTEASKRIRADDELKTDKVLAEVNDDDLQAVVWFIEKELWTVNNWTSAAGEGGSFELEASLTGNADQARIKELRRVIDSSKSKPDAKAAARAELATLERTVDRFVGGLSTQMSLDTQGIDYVPTDADMARLAEQIRLAAYEGDGNTQVLASKMLSTQGRYGGIERSLDMEVVAREGYDPTALWAEMLRQAQEARQDSTFLSRVLRDGENVDPLRHRPGVEIYLREAAQAAQLEAVLADLAKEGVEFLTVIVDGRRMPGAVAGEMPPAVGVRLQYVPEFDQRYGFDNLSGLDDAALAAKINAKADEMAALAERVLATVDGVAFAGQFWHDTQVAFSHQYQEKLDAIATGNAEGTAGEVGGPQWSGQPVRAGLESADRQARETAGGQPDGGTDTPVGGDAQRPDTETLNQGPRGTFSPKNLELALNENADLSTFLHETGHFFLEVMADLASQPGAPADIATDMAALVKWFGVADLATWNSYTLDQKRPYHERFAESFEQYLMEGKAPSLELQPLFRKFRAWMLNVYKSLQAFIAGKPDSGIVLSDEVRQVFDRMLASEEQIQQANEVAGLLPNEEADAEANEKLTARSLRDLKWTVNARAREIKKLQKQAAEQRKEVEAEVTLEVNAMPEFQAKEMLATMRKENKEQLNDTELAIIADSYGYPDANTMLQAIDAAGKKSDVIEGMTDQRMLEQYGDLVDQRAIEQAANEAVHNEARARSLATELRSQAEMLNPRTDTGQVTAKGSKITINALMEAAKQFAANVIARTPLRDLKAKAWQHTAAERRAGKRWQEATAKGETQEAVKAKQDQMLNNAAAKAAVDAQLEMRKILEFFKRVIGDNNEKVVKKGRDPDVVNAARAILGAYGVAPKGAKTALEYMALVEKNDPAMYAALQPSMQGALNMAQPLDALTMEELRGLHEEIQAMWHLAKRSRQMEIDGNLMDMDDAEAELQARMQVLGVPTEMPGDTGAVTPREELARKLQFVGSILRRVEQWAQGMGSEFTKLVFQPVKDAANAYRADRVVYRKRYQALIDNVAPTLTKGLIVAPELNYTFGEGHNGIGHAELLHAILHTGNASNKRKLLLGRGWATENADGTLNTGRWDAFLQRMHDTGVLTKAHYDFAQGVWDLLEQTKPLAQKTHRDVFGRYFAEVTADSFDTPFGSYTGGYVPAQADPRIVQDVDLRKLAEAENENMSFSFPGTNKGFTKGRVEYNRPLMLDLRTIGQHIDKVLLFSHMEPAVRDVQKLLSRKGVSYSLGRIDPTIYAGMLTPWLSRSARQVVETPIVGDGGISRVMSAARGRAGMALMFANVSNTLQQITGFSVAAIKVKPASMMRATATFIASPKQTAKAVADASSFMANRMENEIAAINDAMDAILLDPGLYEKSQAWTQKHAYFLQTAMANTMEPIIWTAAYNDAITRGDSDRDAVRHADSVIRTTQGSTLPEDVSRLETGPAWARLFTQFIGYFNMLANTNGTALLQVSREMGLKKGAGKALGIITLGMLAPIWVAEAIAHAMRGGPEDEDKDGYLDDWLMAVFGMGTIKGAFAMVPFLGQAAQLTVNRFNDNPADDKFSLSPAVSLIESTVSAPFSVYKAIADDGNRQKAVRDVASAVSIVTGLPAFAVARPLGYLAGVEQGKVEPTDALDLARGLVSGTASPASK